jgi:hypothetical protein
MEQIRKSQQNHYRGLLEKHAGTTMAVSSESAAHKRLRFEQISKVFGDDTTFSLHDVGMGLGAYGSYLIENHPNKSIAYSGSEILPEFVEGARAAHPTCQFFCRDISEQSGKDFYDYVILSGVFHQRRETSISDWEKFSRVILRNAFAMCRKGLAFNFISPFVDFYQTEVYYANLPRIISFVVEELSRFFVINHSYALYEFTIYVYRENVISARDNAEEFKKYFKKATSA